MGEGSLAREGGGCGGAQLGGLELSWGRKLDGGVAGSGLTGSKYLRARGAQLSVGAARWRSAVDEVRVVVVGYIFVYWPHWSFMFMSIQSRNYLSMGPFSACLKY